MQKLINLDDVTKETRKEHNTNWPQILSYPYRILIIPDSGFGQTNLLFDLISN